MAAILGLTDRRLRQLVEMGLPKTGHGLYPMAACVQWYVKYWQDKALGREANDTKRSQEEIDLLLKKAKLEEATGHLVSRTAMVQLVSAGFLRLGKWLDGLPLGIARKHGLSSEVQRSIRAYVDEGRANYVRDCREYIDVVDDGKSAGDP